MPKNTFCKRAQTIVEYSVIIAVVAAALGTVGIVFRCALQKHIRGLAVQLDSRAYSPERTTSSSTSDTTSTSTETYNQGVSDVTYNETTTRDGTEQVNTERM